MTEETKEVSQGTQQEAQQEAAQTELNINDLIAIRSIIEVASQRGAFKAAELEAVGKTFNRLNTFLEAVTAKKED